MKPDEPPYLVDSWYMIWAYQRFVCVRKKLFVPKKKGSPPSSIGDSLQSSRLLFRLFSLLRLPPRGSFCSTFFALLFSTSSSSHNYIMMRVASRGKCLSFTRCSRFFPISTTQCGIFHGHPRIFSSVAAGGITVSSPPRPAPSSSIVPSAISSWFRFVSLKEMEKSEIDHLEEFIDLTKHLTNHVTDQADAHPLIEIAQSIRNREYLRATGTDSTIPNVNELCKVKEEILRVHFPSHMQSSVTSSFTLLTFCTGTRQLYSIYSITRRALQIQHNKSANTRTRISQ